VERRHVAAVLLHVGGNVTHAARSLAIDRVTLYNKIKKYGLKRYEDEADES
jgi:two-component system response regulator AtoC